MRHFLKGLGLSEWGLKGQRGGLGVEGVRVVLRMSLSLFGEQKFIGRGGVERCGDGHKQRGGVVREVGC